MFEIETGDSISIVDELVNYMQSQGLVFRKINFQDSSPYAILQSNTSVGYRSRSKWNRSGIVFFCCKTDADNLSDKLSLDAYDNSTDKARPYAVFIPQDKFKKAVEVLSLNPQNINREMSISQKSVSKEYEILRQLNNKGNVALVQEKKTKKLFVKKEYTIFNEDVFKMIKDKAFYGIPKIYKTERKKNVLYVLEEYIEGKTLLEILESKGVFDEEQIKRIAINLCNIVEQLHSLNPQVLHRDIKPSNIIMNNSGEIYLLDFNASKETNLSYSQDTVLYGTQYFAAPEQLIGYKVSTPATDVFGIGATLTYLMTGLYHSELIAHGKFHSIFEKCVQMEPKSRYQSVAELRKAFIDA